MNTNIIKKIGLAVFFLLLLGVPYLLDRYQQTAGSADSTESMEQALQRHGFYLQEVSEQAGVDFTHQAPTLDDKLAHIMPQVASVGASVSIADFDNDGLQDFYLTNSAHGTDNALYRNMGDGTFRDVASELGVASLNTPETGVSMGSVWGDYDNDGYEDLLVYKWGRSVLFHNDEGNGFTDVSTDLELPEWANINSAIWFDYDNDGHLDFFMGGYFHQGVDLWNIEDTEMMPESFEYANNGGRKYLYHNQGDGTFKEVSKELGIDSNRWALAASSADLSGDGYPDLVIANDYGIDELYINTDGTGFTESGSGAGLGFSPKSGMNVSYGDIMNQGKLAVYITNISEPGVLIQGNNLWMSQGKSKKASFNNLAGDLGIEVGGWSYGAQFGDLNMDGHQDLYLANGYISAEKGTDYWYDFSKVAGGNRAIIKDAKNWPAMKGRSLSGFQDNKIWVNDGAGRFQEVADAVNGELGLDSRAVALGDFFNDGSLDIIVASQNGPLKIYDNTVKPGNHWLGIKLTGTSSNSSAIGAEIELFRKGRSQLQLVSGGSGFSAQNQRPVYFGLGEDPDIARIEIRWPSGISQTIESPATDTLITVTEPPKGS